PLCPLEWFMQVIAILVSVAFAGLAILHIYWALGGKLDSGKMIPVADGKPVFTPGVLGTFLVAAALACFAAISLALGFRGVVSVDYQPSITFAGFAIGAVLVLRAIGEFKYVGFFKRVRGGDFATYDSLVYSPFCLLAGSAFLFLAANQP
ncbi:MAG: DUF3995 domain-containing protein, partial [Desulfosalsimonadaceae bacterium]|nr:DUF3995 domain-containing protein [Desulfosalsimonadaceae bacterium]